jgi:hypothetical protein
MTKRCIGSPAIAALLAIIFVLLYSSCGQSTSSANQPTPSAATSPIPAASPPPGGPAPAQLLGKWLLRTSNPKPEIGLINGKVQLTLTAMTFHFLAIDNSAFGMTGAPGDVVVNNTEIDFFSGDMCGLQLPNGVGRYKWTLTAGLLHFTPLNQDPCSRADYLANQSYSRIT